ncbi:hypothetical protein ACSNOK_34135, partial [Streptomyces sp. URMC 126]|uniref:hypothetical protein n=1 Tax=Streptomyces sp. URMC 126 TaxID=3423401 RepID=UPI003F1CEBA6
GQDSAMKPSKSSTAADDCERLHLGANNDDTASAIPAKSRPVLKTKGNVGTGRKSALTEERCGPRATTA